MTLNDRHIKNSSFTPSPSHTALKKIAKVAGLIIATIVGLTLSAILKPIIRGVGWIISILTAEEKEKARQDAINKLRDEEMA